MQHRPVLLKEALYHLNIRSDGVYVDGTLGAGGHTREILGRLSGNGKLIAIDFDSRSIANAKENLSVYSKQLTLVHGNYKNLPNILIDMGISMVDGILLDLGWNWDQFADSDRGFSFHSDGPLDMNLGDDLDEGEKISAWDIVNNWQEESIADIIYGYGDERYARRIAKAIIERRRESPIDTTGQLAKLIESSVPNFYRNRKIHPATKTFQALRITVNHEIESLKTLLAQIMGLMNHKGRVCIISFHSGEDRIVKNTFRNWEKENIGIRIEKRGITASYDEIKTNNRARSARLRIFEKI